MVQLIESKLAEKVGRSLPVLSITAWTSMCIFCYKNHCHFAILQVSLSTISSYLYHAVPAFLNGTT